MEVELFLRVIVHLEPLLSVLVAPAFHHRQGSIDRVYAVLKIVDRQLKPSHKKEANGKPVGHDDNVHPLRVDAMAPQLIAVSEQRCYEGRDAVEHVQARFTLENGRAQVRECLLERGVHCSEGSVRSVGNTYVWESVEKPAKFVSPVGVEGGGKPMVLVSGAMLWRRRRKQGCSTYSFFAAWTASTS
jgi:hypothetical protein